MLDVAGLRKRYGPVAALDGFDLAVAAGEIAGLVGHNGAGKTTFVEVVTGLTRADGGSARVGGVDALRRPRVARALTGVAPQEQAVYPPATARENVRLFAGLRGLRGRAAEREVGALLDELALGPVADRRTAVLSGGERRRVQAATAMVGRPPLLLLDEPTVGADPVTRQALLAAVRARAAEGAAVVYTTHYLPELAELDATLAVAAAGRVVARGTQAALLADLPGGLELEFAGPVPPGLACRGQVTRTAGGERVSLVTREPAAELAAVVAAGHELRSADVRHADLDDLYASLATGDRRAA